MEKRLALASLVLTLACSDEGGGASAPSTGLPANQSVNTLTQAEKTQFCRWLVEQNHERFDARNDCLADAVYDTASKESCEQELARCIAEEDASRDEDRSGRLASCDEAEVEVDCTVTVEQIETCVDDMAKAHARIGERIACGSTQDEATRAYVEPASCAAIPSRCFPNG